MNRLQNCRVLLLRFVSEEACFSSICLVKEVSFSCSPFRYGLMKSCWRWSEDSRPSLRKLHSCLETAAQSANDKAVLQVPELVVPELYAAVAGISVESISYCYSILWRSWDNTHSGEIVYPWNQFLQEQRLSSGSLREKWDMDLESSPTHFPRSLKWCWMRLPSPCTLETEKCSFISVVPVLKTQDRWVGRCPCKGGFTDLQSLLQHGIDKLVLPTTGLFPSKRTFI